MKYVPTLVRLLVSGTSSEVREEQPLA